MVAKPERTPQGHVTEVSVVTSSEDIAPFVDQVTSTIKFDPRLLDEATTGLRAFLQSIYDRPGPGSIAFIGRRDMPSRPILDVYVLWADSIQLSSDAQEMREIASDHTELVMTLRSFGDRLRIDDHVEWLKNLYPFHDSLMSIVDPRRYPSPEHLNEELSARWTPFPVVTCALQK